MSCVSCGKQIPSGARYCVHCGAEQSPPTPIAAVAAAMTSHPSRARAANAPQAEPKSRPSIRAANQPLTPERGEKATHSLGAAGGPPAYLAVPGRSRLAMAVIGGCVVVAIGVGAAVLWRLQDRSSDGSSVAQAGSAAPGPVAAAPAPMTVNPQVPSAPPASTPSAETGAAPQAASATATTTGSPAAAAEPPVEIKPLPPKPAPTHPARRPSPEKTSPSPAPATPATPAPPPEPARAAIARAPAATPLQTPVANRWTRMEEDLSHCTREDFIARVVCAQRVRFRYCDGYWGKAAQCPANPPPERGQ